MARRPLLACVLLVALAAHVAALQLRVVALHTSDDRVHAAFELRDLLREQFLETLQQRRAVFLQVQAELWEQRRITDRLALTTPALTFRIDRAAGGGVTIADQFGGRSAELAIDAPLPIAVELGPASGLADDRTYYVRAQASAASIADRDIDHWGAAIFGDDDSAAGLASLGRFVFRTLVRVGRYLESASTDVTSRRYTGRQIRASPPP